MQYLYYNALDAPNLNQILFKRLRMRRNCTIECSESLFGKLSYLDVGRFQCHHLLNSVTTLIFQLKFFIQKSANYYTFFTSNNFQNLKTGKAETTQNLRQIHPLSLLVFFFFFATRQCNTYRLLHRKCDVRIYSRVAKLWKTHSFAALTRSFSKVNINPYVALSML